MTYPLLTLDALSLGFRAQDGAERSVLRNLSLTVNQGETLGLVGESGSGKSTVALAAMGYLKPGLEVFSGQVRFDGRDVFSLAPRPTAWCAGGVSTSSWRSRSGSVWTFMSGMSEHS